jgi:hypothetical protein
MAQIGWRQFSSRADIKHLPLHEQKKKFLIENNSRLQEDLHILSRMHGAAAAVGGSGGVAIDGPITGAVVRSNVGTAITDASGNFKLPGQATGVITVTGGVDSITGLPYEGELVGYPEYKTISPITTFAHYLKEASAENPKTPTLTIDEAITKTFVDSFDYFGISLSIEDKDIILQKDYIEESIVNNNKVGISAQAVATQIEAIAETIGVALDGSQQAANAAKAGKVIAEFSVANRKRTAYAAFGRAANGGVGFEISDITDLVKWNDPVEQSPAEGVTFTNVEVLDDQLAQTKNELASLASQDQYTNNYLTTRIQAVNRAQKTIIKNEVISAVENPEGYFSDIDEVSTSPEVEDALRQIEKGKANETTPTLDGEANEIPVGKGTRFTQLKLNKNTGKFELTQLELKDIEDKAYYYFGKTKDSPLLLTEFEGVYQPKNFTGTSEPTNFQAVSIDTPLYIEITTPAATFDTVTTYTFRPTLSNRAGEIIGSKANKQPIGQFEGPEQFALGRGGMQVALRLSQITEKKTEKVIDHIVDSEVGSYTAIYTAGKGDPITFDTSVNSEFPSGNVLVIMSPKGVLDVEYQLGRYEKSPSTLLALTSPKLLGVNIQDLVFKDNELNISIPASSGQEEAVMHIGFTLA